MRLHWRLFWLLAWALRLIGLNLVRYATTRTWVEDGWQKTKIIGIGWRIERRKA